MHAVLYSTTGGTTGVDDLPAALATARRSGGLLWVALDHPQADDFVEIEEVFGLHPLAVDDAVTARDRPKLDLYDDTRFLMLATPVLPSRVHGEAGAEELAAVPLRGRAALGRVMAFAGAGFIVTVRQEDGDTIERARAHASLEKASGGELSSGHALHALLDTVVEDLADASQAVEQAILRCAERLFGRAYDDESGRLYAITLQLLALAHAVHPLVEPLRHLSDGGSAPTSDPELARRFQDVLDHVLLLEREIGDHRELVEQLRASNDSRIALRQNTDMRRISAWAAIIAVPTAVTGFYGMNVPYPGAGQAGGVISAVLAQLLLALGLFVAFRRRGWL